MSLTKEENGRTFVAILVSRGFGAGWSTWNSSHPQCLTDDEIARLVIDGDLSAAAELADTKFGSGFFSGGADGLYVKWVPLGARFQIEEYDGAETLVLADEVAWMVAK